MRVASGGMVLQNGFSDFFFSGIERIEGDGLWSCFSFIIITEAYRQMGSYMEREMDECGKRWNKQDDFLILYIYLYVLFI